MLAYELGADRHACLHRRDMDTPFARPGFGAWFGSNTMTTFLVSVQPYSCTCVSACVC